MSSSERNSPIGRMLKRWPCSVISPALTEKLLFCSSVASRCTSMLCAAIRPASIRMRTSRGSDALQLDARDAGHALQRPLQVALERVVLVGEVLVGGDADDHDRLVGRVEREREDTIGAGRQLGADRIELGAHVERRGVDVAAPVEARSGTSPARPRSASAAPRCRRASRALPRPGRVISCSTSSGVEPG